MEEGSCSSSSDAEKEPVDADVVPDSLMDLAKDTMTFMDTENHQSQNNSNNNNNNNINNNVTPDNRKRKRQRARSVAVRTLFISKLPMDATAREIYLLFVRFKGFQGSILRKSPATKVEGGGSESPVAFAMFRKRDQAEAARLEINGLRYDPGSEKTIRADYARANNNSAKINTLKRTRWDEDAPTVREPDTIGHRTSDTSRRHDVVRYPNVISTAPSPNVPAQNAVVYATADDFWCHHPHQMALESDQNHSPGHAHIIQMQPPLQPAPVAHNYTMMTIPTHHHPHHHPAAPLIITAPYITPPPPPPQPQPQPITMTPVAMAAAAAKPCCAYAQQDMADAMTKCTLFVANMGMETSEDELMAVFTRLPSFKRLKMLRNKERTPVAFVEYEDHHSACQAKTLFNGKTLFTSNENGGIRIEFAKKPMIEAKWNNKLNYG